MELIFLSIGWLLGVFLGLNTNLDRRDGGGELSGVVPLDGATLLLALAALAVVAAGLGWKDRRLRITALAVAAGVLGISRGMALPPAADPISTWVGSWVAVEGVVADRPEVRDGYQSLLIEVDRVRGAGVVEPLSGRLLVRTDPHGDWMYGDRALVQGVLRPVDVEARFYAEFLRRRGVHSTLEYPNLRLLDRQSSPDLLRTIDGARTQLERACAELLPEPQASLLAGILVGSRAGMPADFRDALKATSTSHMVAVSGFNVSLVAGIAQAVALRLLARREATLLAVAAVWLYSILTGLPPSALRSALMTSMALSAILVGRGGDPLSFLLFSAALMVGHDPFMLYDLGFQLSFLATAGLVLLEPVLRSRLGRLPGWLASSLSVTMAAQLFTLPVLVESYHSLSLVSPLSNLLVTSVLPGLMLVGGVSVGLYSTWHPLGEILAPIAWLYLTYMVEAIRWTARLPLASVSTGEPAGWTVAIYYLLLLAISLWPLAEMKSARAAVAALASRMPRWLAVGGLATLASLMGLGLSARPDGRLHLYFLDVGHGDATLVRDAQGRWVLVDGGPSPTALMEALGRRQGFLDRGLDAVVLTGYGEDKLAGLLEVARRHPVGVVLQPGPPPTKGAGRAWAELAAERGLVVSQAAAGQSIPLGEDAKVEVIWVAGDDTQIGESTQLLMMAAGSVRVLLPGDIPRGTQASIASKVPRGVDLLRVPRHGAAGALDDGFLRAASPRAAVVAVDAQNRFGHPAESTLEQLRGATLLRTDRNGTVEMVIDGRGWELLTDR